MNRQAGAVSAARRPRLMFVGAFPPPDSPVVGGNVSDCRALLASSFASRFELILFDSTQPSVAASPLARRAARAAARIARFLWVFERRRPDRLLIFASSGFSFLEKACFAAYARLRGAQPVLSIRSGHFLDQCRSSRLFRAVARVLVRAPKTLLCQGERWRQFFIAELGVREDRCAVVESWVATGELLSLAAPRESGRLGILFLGGLERFKGVFDLLDAVEILRRDAQLSGFHLSIAGDGTERESLAARIRERGLSNVVHLAGVLRGEARLAAIAQSDVFVLPSHTEGLPNAMIEAMAAGLAVVVTPVGSIPDVIVDHANGLLVPPRNPQALAAALRELLLSSALRESLGRAARDTAATRFGTERAAEVLSSLLGAA